jgi:DNA-binding GntR family transcriptional regulator
MMTLPDKLSAHTPADGHRTLAERAYAALHEAIVTGVLTPGERLTIEELAAVFGLSPMPIREALRQLDASGLVNNVPHRGASVTGLSIDDLREVYEARLVLEELAIRRAAEDFTPANGRFARQRLEEHVRAYRDGDLRRVWSTHTAFHFALYEAAGSRWLERLIEPLWQSSERYRFAMLPVRLNLDQRRLEHERILAACVNHHVPAAVAELHDHLARTANLIANEMGGGDLFRLLDPAGD